MEAVILSHTVTHVHATAIPFSVMQQIGTRFVEEHLCGFRTSMVLFITTGLYTPFWICIINTGEITPGAYSNLISISVYTSHSSPV